MAARVPEFTTAIREVIRTLDQMLAAGSIENARDAVAESRMRRSLIAATVDTADEGTPEPSRVA
jgi:hypothetical protein